MSEPGNTPFPPEYLPSVGEVVSVLKMCTDHDIPLEKLPGLWDEHQRLQQVERRAGIQNGNMDRELKRLRGLTSELDKQIADERLYAKGLEADKQSLTDQLGQVKAMLEDMNAGADELRTQYEALLCRCKHFEGVADQSRIDTLEDLLAHYKAGMAGMKDIIQIRWFSNEFRLELVRRALYVFEPELKRMDCSGSHHDA